MFIDDYREVIKTSTLNIPERLKTAYPTLSIVRNHETQAFEVHDLTRKEATLELNLPFDRLDYRTIQFVKEHDIKHARKILEEIDRHNEKLELDAQKKSKDMIDTVCRDIHSYVTKHESKETVDLSDSKLYKDILN